METMMGRLYLMALNHHEILNSKVLHPSKTNQNLDSYNYKKKAENTIAESSSSSTLPDLAV
jgi:hypothetical protein